MSVASGIRELLPICGDCVNAKLVVWSSSVDKDDLRMVEYQEIESEYYYFRVQCNWLKGATPAPLDMVRCEGKRAHKD